MDTLSAASKASPSAMPALPFWDSFVSLCLAISEAADGTVLQRGVDGEWRLPDAAGSNLTQIPQGLAAFERSALDELAAAAVRADDAFAAYPDDRQPLGHLLAFCVSRDETSTSVLILRSDCRQAEMARATLRRVKTARTMIEALRLREQLAQSEQSLRHFATVLDLLTLLHEKEHFQAAAMELCNELSARLQAERVSLGWLRHGRVRLRAISHAERFEQKMNVVAALEVAMEESLEQDDEIFLPADSVSHLIHRDHERFAKLENVSHLLTIPLRLRGEPISALTLERSKCPFTREEAQMLRLLCDHAAPQISELERRSHWFGARWAKSARHAAGRLLGFEYTGWKLVAVATCAGLIALATITKTYHIDAPFTLRSDQEAQLPAPFDGYLAKVLVRPGDNVKSGDPLLELDTRELRLEEAGASAEQSRFLAEASQAQSESKPSDMLVAQASATRAKARLDLARYRIAQATVVSPIAGAIVEGELREKIGAPVKQGDMLIKVVDLSQLHIDAEVAESDLAACQPGAMAELSFASQPRLHTSVRIERIQPVAETREKGTVFVARALALNPPAPWWRPGMTGICKIDGSHRSLLWIATHRTIDFLHNLLWW